MIRIDRRPSGNARRVTLIGLFGALCLALLGLGAGTASAAPHNWEEVAQCESGGDWSTNTGNGFYGGLQFTPETWKSHGGKGLASEASKAEQIMVAENVLQTQGRGAWPVCGQYLTLDTSPSESTPESEQDVTAETESDSAPAATSEESTSTMIARVALEGARAIAAEAASR